MSTFKKYGETKEQFREHRTYFEEPYVKTPMFKALTAERTASEVAELTALCKFSREDFVLDHGCGQGRHCRGLRDIGYAVVGLDYSRTLISMAGAEAGRVDSDIPYVRGDMRYLPLRDSVFTWVLSLFGSFGYLSDTDNLEVLKEIRRVMKCRGKLLLDIWNKEFALKKSGEEIHRDLETGEHFIHRSDFSHETKRMTVRRFFVTADKEKEYSISYRLHTLPEISDILDSLGFEILDVRGSFSSKELSPESRGLVVISEKRQAK
jgi:SAM-dependent methyltransferase